MSLSQFFFRVAPNSSVSLPEGIKFAPDGSIRFTGNATVFSDQVTHNIVPDKEIVEYVLSASETEVSVDYGVFENEVYVRVKGLNPGEKVYYYFTKSNSGKPRNDKVFYWYDDFESYNTTDDLKKKYSTGGHKPWLVDMKERYLGTRSVCSDPSITDGQNSYLQFSLDIPEDAIISFYQKVSSERGWDFLRFYIGNSQVSAISGEVNWTKFERQVSKGIHSFKWIYTKDGSVTRGADKGWIDNLVVRSALDTLHTEIEELAPGQYKVTIMNNTPEIISDAQVKIPGLPVDNYVVVTKSITPTLTTIAFPPAKISSIQFYTQFSHNIKIGSTCRFHLHTFIPPDATPGKVKFQLEWKTLPVERVVGDERITEGNFSISTHKITKVFEITEEDIGKHIVLNFGEIDKVFSISQIIFHRLTRLGTHEEDTFNYEIPILFVDWHTEIDSLGSQDEFVK